MKTQRKRIKTGTLVYSTDNFTRQLASNLIIEVKYDANVRPYNCISSQYVGIRTNINQ